MKSTGARLIGDDQGGIEQAVLESRHRFAYKLVRAASSPDAEVLEVGFGQGHGPSALVDRFSTYEGLEVDTEALEHTTPEALPEHVSFRLNDGVQVFFRDNSFDIVLALQVAGDGEAIAGARDRLADDAVELGKKRRAAGALAEAFRPHEAVAPLIDRMEANTR